MIALILVGMTENECNILHVAPEDESLKSKHVVQYTLCPISYAGEKQEHYSYTKFIFLTVIPYTNIKLCTVGHICKMSSIIYNTFLSEISISTVLNEF